MSATLAFRELGLPGCYEVQPRVHLDARGTFIKSYRDDLFREHGLCAEWREEFFTTSRQGVLRGMHFQVPPAQHAKLVTCLVGEALDVLLDLRPGPSYGQWISLSLTGERGSSVYVPEGLAHGFLALTDQTLLHYKVSSRHDPAADLGIRWDSFGFDWPLGQPQTSDRDRGFPPLQAFSTPFASWS